MIQSQKNKSHQEAFNRTARSTWKLT